MTTITKEWLQQTIAEFENTRDDIPFGLDDDDAKILKVLKQALASLDAKPVAFINGAREPALYGEYIGIAVGTHLYTAPPVQETGVYKDMLNIISLLENNEWDEHCTSTVLGSLLESEITRLVGKEQPVPIVPDGYCIMPVALTAKNGAKWALSGEFSTAREVTCPECEGDGCSDCDGRGDWYEDQSIDWTTIKEIYRRAVEVCALPTGQTQDKIA
ncbi:hypothetical protein LD891_16945 [Salmonella enterica]|nr:hypothetical protein [Salmonella enterica]